jgi:DNA polymerase-3 subunit delta'
MHFDKDNNLLSQIIISDSVELEAGQIKLQLSGKRVILFYEEDFLVEHVKSIVKEAYIAESSIKYIIIASLSFNQFVQNSLLKLLEEPPENIRFILISPSKSILLPTILSRLPLSRVPNRVVSDLTIPFSFLKFDLKIMTDFIKKHDRISKREAKTLIEMLFIQASQELQQLNKQQLHAFETALPLLELNSRPPTIFTALLLTFLPQGMM